MIDEHYTIEDRMRSEVYLNAIKTCEELEKIQDNKIKKLEKRLAIAIKALNNIRNNSVRDWDEYACRDCSVRALKEMEKIE